MADGKIWLYAGGLSDRLNVLEKGLTAIDDKMDILDTGAEEIIGFWDSPVSRQWRRELKERLEQIKECTERMGRLLLTLSEIAGMLAEVEKKNSFLVNLTTSRG